MDAFETVKRTMKTYGMAEEARGIIVGFSGGPDSACLLHCLRRIPGGPPLYAVHVNHCLRGEDADRDEERARQFCDALDIPIFVRRVPVRRLAAALHLSEEDAGRRVRYMIFEQVRILLAEGHRPGECSSTEHGAAERGDTQCGSAWHGNAWYGDTWCGDAWRGDAQRTDPWRAAAARLFPVAVAQNADDQAETVLMRIMRGTGVAGLAAMEYVREDGIIRPLLDVPREEVERYCAGQRLSPSIDRTNLETDYTRNRIRLELLPYIKKHFNPSAVEALNRLSAIAREDSSFIDDEAKRRLAAEEIRETGAAGDRGLSIPLSALRDQPRAVRKRMILLLLARLGLEKNVGTVHLRQAEDVLASGRGAAVAEFPEGFRMKILRGRACFYRENPAACRDASRAAEAGGTGPGGPPGGADRTGAQNP